MPPLLRRQRLSASDSQRRPTTSPCSPCRHRCLRGITGRSCTFQRRKPQMRRRCCHRRSQRQQRQRQHHGATLQRATRFARGNIRGGVLLCQSPPWRPARQKRSPRVRSRPLRRRPQPPAVCRRQRRTSSPRRSQRLRNSRPRLRRSTLQARRSPPRPRRSRPQLPQRGPSPATGSVGPRSSRCRASQRAWSPCPCQCSS
mmetsp:Transcript_6914/g.19233  ORF Transcript_6914/g.19233 Transcript_6914/m.19233 type:complete len:200 (-) Transcript_6914:574-1173(-)